MKNVLIASLFAAGVFSTSAALAAECNVTMTDNVVVMESCEVPSNTLFDSITGSLTFTATNVTFADITIFFPSDAEAAGSEVNFIDCVFTNTIHFNNIITSGSKISITGAKAEVTNTDLFSFASATISAYTSITVSNSNIVMRNDGMNDAKLIALPTSKIVGKGFSLVMEDNTIFFDLERNGLSMLAGSIGDGTDVDPTTPFSTIRFNRNTYTCNISDLAVNVPWCDVFYFDLTTNLNLTAQGNSIFGPTTRTNLYVFDIENTEVSDVVFEVLFEGNTIESAGEVWILDLGLPETHMITVRQNEFTVAVPRINFMLKAPSRAVGNYSKILLSSNTVNADFDPAGDTELPPAVLNFYLPSVFSFVGDDVLYTIEDFVFVNAQANETVDHTKLIRFLDVADLYASRSFQQSSSLTVSFAIRRVTFNGAAVDNTNINDYIDAGSFAAPFILVEDDTTTSSEDDTTTSSEDDTTTSSEDDTTTSSEDDTTTTSSEDGGETETSLTDGSDATSDDSSTEANEIGDTTTPADTYVSAAPSSAAASATTAFVLLMALMTIVD